MATASTTTSAPPSFFSMGLSTYKVPKELFATNRKKLLNSLREFISSSDGNVNGNNSNYVVYMEGGGGTSLTRNDTDHEPIFRQESYFHYLFGVREPDFTGLIHVNSGETILFAPRLPESYATVMGEIKSNDTIRDEYDVDAVYYSDTTEEYLKGLCIKNKDKNKDKNKNKDKENADDDDVVVVLVMEGTNSDSGNTYMSPKFKSPDLTQRVRVDKDILFPLLAECRVTKSPYELDLLRHCTEITSLAHVFTMRHMKPGMMEYQAESLFRHYSYYNFGARHVGYTSICGCGPNAAVLHYGHAGAPNDRQIQDGDMLLFDMGAEYFCYGSDVTCSFPASSTHTFTSRQRAIYEGVLNAQREVLGMVKPGVSWLDCHKAAEGAILKALIGLGIVVPGSKTVEELVEMRLGAVFMPHGLGHFIGIDTHDVGGYLPQNRSRILQPGLKSLRTARNLKENMTLTVEPGEFAELILRLQYANNHFLQLIYLFSR